MAWWFAVEALLPGSFNPLASRLLVVAYLLSTWALSFAFDALKRRAEPLFYVGALLLVGHYFYLFHHNAHDLNWVVGAYVVVFALCVMVQSRRWLFVFAVYTFACGVIVWLLDPPLRGTIFLPGLATILGLCLAVLLSRLRLVAELSESTGRFESLFDATFEGVAVHDGAAIVDVNAAFLALFGYTREELTGRSVIELNAPEYRARVIAQIRDVPSGRYESVGVRKDGSRFAMEISSKPHTYNGRLLRLAAVRDISDRKRIEEERLSLIQEQAARASAQEAIRVRDEFISIASHELKTPITSLRLNLEAFAVQCRAGGSVAGFEKYAQRALRQLDRMTRLVEELLEVSRLGAGRLTLRREHVDLTEVARDVVDSLAEDARRAGCQVELRADEPLVGRWDALRLEQVVENLLRNALIYGAGRPVVVCVQRVDGDSVLLAVEDHGIGLEKEDHQRVFLRFERAVSVSHYGGLGLGLYIAKQIVEAHGGSIRVVSEPGQGATFSVELPLHEAEEQTAHGAYRTEAGGTKTTH